MAAFPLNCTGFKPDYKLFVSLAHMTLQAYVDLKPINIRRIQFILNCKSRGTISVKKFDF